MAVFERPQRVKHFPKRFLLLCLCFCLLVAQIGCVLHSPYYNNFDTRMFYTNFKYASDIDHGKKAAVYDGRIYYESNELGKQGVYSMASDGSNIRLEFETEDIRALAIKSDGIYYSGFSYIGTNDNGAFRCFRLYHRNTSQSAPTDLLAALNLPKDISGDTVWDFYIANNGDIYFRMPKIVWPTSETVLRLGTIHNREIVPAADYHEVIVNNHAFNDPNLRSTLMLYQNFEQYMVVKDEVFDTDDDKLLGFNENITLFDSPINQTVLCNDAVFQIDCERQYSATDRWILRLSDESILLANAGAIHQYSFTENKGRVVFSFPSYENIHATYDTGSDILVFTKTFRSGKFLLEIIRSRLNIPDMKHETLYRFHPDSGKMDQVLALKARESFINADHQIVAVASKKAILLYDISGENPRLIRTIALNHTIVDPANKVDTAGGWLFLYHFNAETQRDELIEKVFIGS